MTSEKKEKKILLISFIAGLLFAIAEFVFAIYTHSQSVLMDAAYDASELIFIILILFLTPLFHKPISEKRPFGFFQIESMFLIIKGFMMLSVTLGLSMNVIQSALTGGNHVNGAQIALFQLILGFISIGIYMVMRHLNRSVSSPTVDGELLGWKLDTAYSIGMSGAFFVSTFLDKTPVSFIVPYFDSLVAIGIVVFMLPENIKMLWGAMQDVFLFSPEESTVNEIKEISNEVLLPNGFVPVFYDITRTGRRLWIAVYFEIFEESLPIIKLEEVTFQVNQALGQQFENCYCELIVTTREQERKEHELLANP